jgi:hypothetical protein
MHQIIEDLKLDQFFIVYQGKHRLEMEEKIQILPVNDIIKEIF